MISMIPLSAGLLGVYWIRWLIWKRKELPIVIPILFTCFFLPKLNLVQVSRLSTAGIRVDDFLALILLFIAIMDPATFRNRHIRRGVGMLAALAVLNLLSVFIGRIRGYDNQILLSVMMVIRKFEYFAFALVGIYTVRRLKDPYGTFFSEFTLMSAFHIVLAALQVLGKAGYIVNGADAGDYFQRAAVSTFNGYYEYGQFLCFGCAVYICEALRPRSVPAGVVPTGVGSRWSLRAHGGRVPVAPSRWVSVVMLGLSLGMLVLSRSRSSLVIGALLVLIAVYFPLRGAIPRIRLIVGGYGGILLLAAVTVVFTGIIGWELVGRFGSISLDDFTRYWAEFLRRGDFSRYREMIRTNWFEFDAISTLGYLDRISDWSLATRYLKWGAALDGFRLNPLLGYGTGVTHVMDGNYIRLLAETGILGTGLWLFFYGYFMRTVRKACRRSVLSKALWLMMLSILLNSVLIDMFDASKPMEMMWLLVGGVIAFARSGERIEKRWLMR